MTYLDISRVAVGALAVAIVIFLNEAIRVSLRNIPTDTLGVIIGICLLAMILTSSRSLGGIANIVLGASATIVAYQSTAVQQAFIDGRAAFGVLFLVLIAVYGGRLRYIEYQH